MTDQSVSRGVPLAPLGESDPRVTPNELSSAFIHIVPGSQHWICRAAGCPEYTAKNVPYGYCEQHLRAWADGADLVDKLGFPPMGTP
jgi:hypothetical protein